jgi:peptidoglycan-associated lipoprotein
MPPIGGDNPMRPRAGETGLPPGLTQTLPRDIDSTPNKPIVSETVGTPGKQLTAADVDTTNMDENREEFKAQTVYFDLDKSNIKASEVSKLAEVARRMKSSFQGRYLRIEGHCDERGTEEYNRALGDRRAQSIRETLVNSLGLDKDRIETRTFGEEKPVDHGHSEAAWKKNRRGEIILLVPKGSP